MKRILPLLIFLSSLQTISCQDFEWGSGHAGMAFTGGGLQLSFGSVTYIEVSPMLGYHVNDLLAFGIGGSYAYLNDNYYKVSMPFYSGRFFGELNISPEFFVHAEYEMMFYEDKFSSLTTGNGWVTLENIWIGAGYKQALSENISLYGLILYNANNPPVYTPFENLTYRAGIEINFNLKKN